MFHIQKIIVIIIINNNIFHLSLSGIKCPITHSIVSVAFFNKFFIYIYKERERRDVIEFILFYIYSLQN